ncbi:hypothetical protein [Metabacillus fastidiosus]|uniref:hypothetical protein n=1 Tax=Metabacillus fastidiosus TaxID=1458 RepID=UPI002E1E42D4|nr:hypothetical protein [Metabacillus fastidiosus]
MSKKKIAKFGLTAAVAATTVVTATPADAASVSATEKAVQQAAQSANALVKYYSSTDLKVSGEFTTALNNAKKAIANAKAAVAKYNGKEKAYYEATVANAEAKQLDAARYIDAVRSISGELVSATKAVDAHIKAQTLNNETVTAYNKLSDSIKKSERVIGKVRGKQVRDAFKDSFLTNAKLTREAIIYEVSQYQLLNKIAEKVAKGDLNGLDAELAKLDRLEERAAAIKEAGRKAYPGRDDVYPSLPVIEEQLRSKETDLRDKIVKNNPLPAVVSVKAINATTVEVAFKEDVKDIASVRFAIAGLEVKNAAVKQTDSKAIVITTSTQEGAKEYTVKAGESTLGKFKGVSAVIPNDIKVTTTSVQGVVGKEVTLKASIDKKEAGVPVTFNVDAANNSLNKDIVAEVYTDADGVATFTYTQYNGGYADAVAVYATGNASKRDFASVYWGVTAQLTIEDGDDKKGTSLVNGDKKVYKVKLVNGVNGKGIENAAVNVTFAENVNVTSDKLSTATITDPAGNTSTPYQLTNGNTSQTVIRTDKDGIATFTVSGSNTKATPIVFIDGVNANDNNDDNGKLDVKELQAAAPQVTFAGAQVSNTFELKAEGSDHVAVGPNNGRVYTLTVKDKDGKAYANGVVNLALNEDIDKNISTNTKASFAKYLDKDGKEEVGQLLPGVGAEAKNQVKLDKNGQAKFVLVSDTDKDYGTPIVWIDQNTAENKQTGVLENGEPSQLGEKTFFETSAVKASQLKVYDKDGKEFDKVFNGTDTATFTYNALNQSNKVITGVNKEVTFEVVNNGAAAIKVVSPGNADVEVAAYGRTTVKVSGTDSTVKVTPVTNDDTKVTVSASGYQLVDGKQSKYLGNQTATATFSKYANVSVSTGAVSNVNTAKDVKTLTVTDAKGKVFNYTYKDASFQLNGNTISEAKFESVLVGAEVTVTKDANDKLTFNIIKEGTDANTNAVDKKPLETAIANAKAEVATGKYTDASVTAFNAEIAKAETALANAKTNADVTAAVTALQDAQKKLALKDTTGQVTVEGIGAAVTKDLLGSTYTVAVPLDKLQTKFTEATATSTVTITVGDKAEGLTYDNDFKAFFSKSLSNTEDELKKAVITVK